MRMKLIAAGAAVAMIAPFAAHAGDAEWYGRIHLSVDHYSDADNDGIEDGTYLSNNSSRFGFTGSQTVDGGLTLLGHVESSVAIGGDWTATRDAYVGLDGDFGKLLVGHLPAGNQYAYDVNFFADQVGDAAGGQTANIGGRDMALWYGTDITEELNVSATLLPEGHYGDDAGFGGRAAYSAGGMNIAVTHFATEDVVDDDITAASFKMDYGQGEVGVSYTAYSETIDDDNIVVGGTYNVSEQGTLKLQHQMRDDWSVSSVGYDHAFADGVVGYAAFATSDDWGGGVHQAGKGDGSAGEGWGDDSAGPDSTVISFGMMYNF